MKQSRIDEYKKLEIKFNELLSSRNYVEAEKVRLEMYSIKYDTSELVGSQTFKVKIMGIISEQIVEFKIKPKGFGFDYWADNKKVTRGNAYLIASTFEEAKKVLIDGPFDNQTRVEI